MEQCGIVRIYPKLDLCNILIWSLLKRFVVWLYFDLVYYGKVSLQLHYFNHAYDYFSQFKYMKWTCCLQILVPTVIIHFYSLIKFYHCGESETKGWEKRSIMNASGTVTAKVMYKGLLHFRNNALNLFITKTMSEHLYWFNHTVHLSVLSWGLVLHGNKDDIDFNYYFKSQNCLKHEILKWNVPFEIVYMMIIKCV